MLNKFRYVRYTDDGCSIYECLVCRNSWEIRGGIRGWVCCPYCRTVWEGELEWDTRKENRRFQRQPQEGRLRNIIQVDIQERFIESGKEPQDDWKTIRTVSSDAAPWYLKHYRKNNDESDEWLGHFEYRVVKNQ